MGLSALSMLSAVFVSGIILLVLGLIALIPLAAANFQIVLLSVGALLTILSGTAVFLGFSEKRWLELSKSYEMMDAVLGPWEGLTPPNPFKPSTAVSIDASSEPGQATTAAESASVATNDTNAPATAATIAETAVHSEIEEDLRLLSRDARDAANSPFGSKPSASTEPVKSKLAELTATR